MHVLASPGLCRTVLACCRVTGAHPASARVVAGALILTAKLFIDITVALGATVIGSTACLRGRERAKASSDVDLLSSFYA